MAKPFEVRVFNLDGQRYELRSWRDEPRDEPSLVPVRAVAEQRLVLSRIASEPGGSRSLRPDSAALDGRADRIEVILEQLRDELERGELVLWRSIPRRTFTEQISVNPEPVEIGELQLVEEEEEEEQELHVLVRLHYDPDRPEAWDDKLRLFTSSDDGGTYDQEVDLASEAQTEREDRYLLVLFRDVIPDQDYSCFLDLGQTEGGYLVFHRHRLGRMHHVPGLPRDTGL